MASARNPRGGSEGLKVGGGILVVVALGFLVAFRFVGPPPPDRIVLATGVAGGGYQAAAERYREALAASSIDLVLRPTAGTAENYELLRSGEVDAALVQGGLAPADVGEFAKGIASVFHEPVWIFHRADLDVRLVTDLAGLRVEVGGPGSGTRAFARDLLAANGLADGDVTPLEHEAAEAAAALLAGEADAAILIMAPDADTVAELMAAEGSSIRLLDVERHAAYARLRPYLAHVELVEGVLDLQRNRPDRDVNLVASTASLLGRSDLHQAVVPLLIQAAHAAHADGDLFTAPGTFPSPRNTAAPLAPAAEQYFANGPSFLYRVFPFPVAATLDRLKILMLPLLTLLLPLTRLAPPVLRWRTRRKIYRWYADLNRIEAEWRAAPADLDGPLAQLDAIEGEIVDTVNVPPSYMHELHHLRAHLDRLRLRVRA